MKDFPQMPLKDQLVLMAKLGLMWALVLFIESL
jgi:hypothetical protein